MTMNYAMHGTRHALGLGTMILGMSVLTYH
jgi:hypothetical protein